MPAGARSAHTQSRKELEEREWGAASWTPPWPLAPTPVTVPVTTDGPVTGCSPDTILQALPALVSHDDAMEYSLLHYYTQTPLT